MQIMCGIMLTLLLFMLTSTLPIETSGFNIPLIPIDSVILPKNHTPEARHQLMAEISRNRVLNLMALSSARAMNPSELMKDVPTTIQPPISLALSNYYITRLGIGSQLYTPYLMVDTGAADTWVQCEGCSNCFPVLGGNFKYNESTSHRSLRCRDPLCVPKLCNSGGVCHYKNQYGGGSTSCTTEGWVSTDTFTFPGTNQTSMKFQVAFGCGIDNQPALLLLLTIIDNTKGKSYNVKLRHGCKNKWKCTENRDFACRKFPGILCQSFRHKHCRKAS